MNKTPKHTAKELVEAQGFTLSKKIEITKQKIKEFVDHNGGVDGVYISFSGGKDSTILCHIAREMYPDIKMVFVNTGLEFPEIVQFVREKQKKGWDIDIIRPEMGFKDVLEKYGYPIISKEQSQYIEQWRNTKSEHIKRIRWEGAPGTGNFKISEKWKEIAEKNNFKISGKCCDVMKKRPAEKYKNKTGRSPIIGTMAGESRLRMQQWLLHGCNTFDGKISSKPLSIWLERDIYKYIKKYNVDIAKPYEMGYSRTGCVFCGFGCHLEEQQTGTNRFLRLEQTHPKLHAFVLGKLGFRDVLDEYGIRHSKQIDLFKDVK